MEQRGAPSADVAVSSTYDEIVESSTSHGSQATAAAIQKDQQRSSTTDSTPSGSPPPHQVGRLMQPTVVLRPWTRGNGSPVGSRSAGKNQRVGDDDLTAHNHDDDDDDDESLVGYSSSRSPQRLHCRP